MKTKTNIKAGVLPITPFKPVLKRGLVPYSPI